MERLKVEIFTGDLSDLEFRINKFCNKHEVVDVDIQKERGESCVSYFAVIQYIEEENSNETN